MAEQQAAFWDVIEVFEKEGLLSYVMLIRSWAEYIYQHHLISGFKAKQRRSILSIFRGIQFPLYPSAFPDQKGSF
jgi:hypothetical protein